MKATYTAYCTLVYDGSMDVEADSLEQARELLRKKIIEMDLSGNVKGFEFLELCLESVALKPNQDK